MRVAILSFCLGVWLLQQQARLPTLLMGGALAALMLAMAMLGYRLRDRRVWFARTMAVAISAALFGFLWAAAFAQARIDTRLDLRLEGQDIQVVGTVASLPQSFERGLRFEFDVEQVETAQARLPAHIALTWYIGAPQHEAAPAVRAGERWRFTVRLKRPHGSANPHGFDYEAWLLEHNIGATGYVRPRGEHTRLRALVPQPRYWLEHWRETLRDKLYAAAPQSPYIGVLVALAIGDQSAINAHDWQIYFRTGVGHLMSISGLHITMIAGLFAWLVYRLWRRVPALVLRLPSRKAAALAGLITALIYCLLAGFAVPAQRTLYMVAVVALALWYERLQSPSRVLCLALAAVLLIDPWAVGAPGFWLSFGAVALLFYADLASGSMHWLRRWMNAQWAITIGLTPLMLMLFQQVSLVSPVANAIAIPVVSWMVTPLAILSALLPGPWFAQIGLAVIEVLMKLLAALAQWPLAVWQQAAPAPWSAALALLGVLWLLAPRGLPARYLGLLLLMPMFMFRPAAPAPGAAWLRILDAGQGLAVIVRTQHHTLLYDTGPAYSADADAGNRMVLPYLRAQGLTQLDGLVISHADQDHAGGAVSVSKGLPVRWLRSSLATLPPQFDAPAYRLPCYADQQWDWDGVHFQMLYPEAQSYAEKRRSNSRSCVLKIETAFGSALLTGDIQAGDEQSLLDQRIKADVLLMPHHGSATSSTDAFIQAVAPTHAIAAVGYRNRFGHPRADVLQRYAQHNATIWRTDRDGALQVKLDAGGVDVSAYRREFPRYWREVSLR